MECCAVEEAFRHLTVSLLSAALLFISKLFSRVYVNRALKRKLNQLAKQLFSLCIEQFRLRPKQNPDGFEKKGDWPCFFFFFSFFSSCPRLRRSPPPGAGLFSKRGFLNINLCVDTEQDMKGRRVPAAPSVLRRGWHRCSSGGRSEDRTRSRCSGTTRSRRIL